MNALTDTDRGWKKLLTDLAKLRGASVAVGFPEDEHREGEASVAEVAAYHEYGVGAMHRPFLAPTIDEGREELSKFASQQAQGLLTGQLSPTMILGRIGEKAKQMVQKTLRDKRPEWAPLTEETKRRKARKGALRRDIAAEFMAGDGNPLIDTGQMINSVQWVIKLEGE
jgi:hypothetical protein